MTQAKFIAAALLALVCAVCALIWLFPGKTGAWILGRFVPYPVAFREARFTGPLGMEYQNLAIRHPSAELSSRRAAAWLDPGPSRGGPQIRGTLEGIRIDPSRAGFGGAPLDFESGEFALQSSGLSGRLLTLKNWLSPELEFGGTAAWDVRKKQLTALNLTGRIRSEVWKRLWPDAGETGTPNDWLPFEVTLKEGFFEARLGGKTVLRSRWTMKSYAKINP